MSINYRKNAHFIYLEVELLSTHSVDETIRTTCEQYLETSIYSSLDIIETLTINGKIVLGDVHL